MKYLALFSILALLLVAACTQPPADVPSASVEQEITGNTQKEIVIEEVETEVEVEAEAEPETEVEPLRVEKPIDTAASSFTWEGFTAVKSHDGTFDDWQGTLFLEGDNVVGVELVIQADSVNSGINGLDAHLRDPDFFDTDKFKEIRFVSDKVTATSATGDLTFRGITKEISFPITQADGKVSADFLVDTTDFEMRYTAINKDVQITFEVQ